MTKYDVCAIGNAIVDYEIEVDEDFFRSNDVEKGLMTLVDEARQAELLQVVNGLIRKKQGGGSAANTMSALSKLGGRGFYTCKVANDEDGQFYLKELMTDGLETNLDPDHLEEGITGKCLVMVSPDADRTMNTFLGITSDLSVNELSEEAIINSKYIYLEGALVTSETGRVALARAKQIAEHHGVKVSLTFFDPGIVKYFRQEMIDLVGEHIDLIFCNKEEALLFTGESSMDKAREHLLQVAEQVVITRGKEGALILDRQGALQVAPHQVDAVDTTGAGDMFAGAYLYGITQGHGPEIAGKIASHASARVVSKYGPRLKKELLRAIATEELA